MEQFIPAGGKAATDEASFIKRHLEVLATQKKKFPDDYVPPERKRAKRAAIANIPVVAPPEPLVAAQSSADGTGPATASEISLSIKSTKPALAYTLKASPTASILSLKEQLAAENGAGAPPPDAQRWVLSGKAMADNKLLNEYNVSEGDKIFLMIQKGWTPLESSTKAAAGAPPVTNLHVPTGVPAPAPLPPVEFPTSGSGPSSPTATRGHIRVPSLTLERADSSESIKRSSPILTPLDTSTPSAPHPGPAGVSSAFSQNISSPALWVETLANLKSRFGDEESARKVFEAWLGTSKVWLTPSQLSRIRDTVGITGMAGR